MINKYGVSFKYHGDKLRWIWPWARYGNEKFMSLSNGKSYESLRQYWADRGAISESLLKNSVVGFHTMHVIEGVVMSLTCADHAVVVMGQELLSCLPKESSLPAGVPNAKKKILENYESVIITTPSGREGSALMDAIPEGKGLAMLVSGGKVIRTNNPKW